MPSTLHTPLVVKIEHKDITLCSVLMNNGFAPSSLSFLGCGDEQLQLVFESLVQSSFFDTFYVNQTCNWST